MNDLLDCLESLLDYPLVGLHLEGRALVLRFGQGRQSWQLSVEDSSWQAWSAAGLIVAQNTDNLSEAALTRSIGPVLGSLPVATLTLSSGSLRLIFADRTVFEISARTAGIAWRLDGWDRSIIARAERLELLDEDGTIIDRFHGGLTTERQLRVRAGLQPLADLLTDSLGRVRVSVLG
jgi:hypothetical protein